MMNSNQNLDQTDVVLAAYALWRLNNLAFVDGVGKFPDLGREIGSRKSRAGAA
jgi:hypothetical protein